MMPPVEPSSIPAALARVLFGRLVGGDDDQVGGDLAVGGLHRPDLAVVVAEERLERGVEVQVHAQLAPRLLDRLHDVRVGHHRQRVRVGVDQVGLDAAVGQRGDHLQAERAGLDDHGALGLGDDLVPLHGLADVLDVVQAAEVAAGHARVGVVPAGGDDQVVVADRALARHRDRLGRGVDRGHLGLVVDVDAGVDVGLLAGQEQPLEVGDLSAVDVGNAARAVGDVLELGVDDDLGAGVGSLDPARGAQSGRSPTDDHCLSGHVGAFLHGLR